jgi:hypothetical protein
MSAPVFLDHYGRISPDLQVTSFARKLHDALRHNATPPFLDKHSRCTSANIFQALQMRCSASMHSHECLQ